MVFLMLDSVLPSFSNEVLRSTDVGITVCEGESYTKTVLIISLE
jgi:hypothetical protein